MGGKCQDRVNISGLDYGGKQVPHTLLRCHFKLMDDPGLHKIPGLEKQYDL